MTPRYSIDWSPVALRDVGEILGYVGLHESLEAAARLFAKISSRIKTLERFPRRCRVVPELKEQGILEYRELILEPYRIFFRLTQKKIGIVGVLDGRRDLEELILQRALDQ